MAAGLLRAVSRLLDLSVLPVEPLLRFLSMCCLSLLAMLITLQQELPAETNHKRYVCPVSATLYWCLEIISPWSEILPFAWQFTKLDLKHLQGGNLGSLCVGIEHHSTSSSNGSAVDAGWRSEWGRVASARTDPVNAAAACTASQPAAGQFHSATRDHTTPHGKHSLDIERCLYSLERDIMYVFTSNGGCSTWFLSACVLQKYSRGATREQWLTDLLYYYSVTMAHGSSARRGNLGLRDMYWPSGMVCSSVYSHQHLTVTWTSWAGQKSSVAIKIRILNPKNLQAETVWSSVFFTLSNFELWW